MGLSYNRTNNQTNRTSYISYILFNYKAGYNTNKKISIYYVVWTRLTRVGCFNWLAHYKRKRIADKNNVQCTLFILNIRLMINQEKGKEEVREYNVKGGYSA